MTLAEFDRMARGYLRRQEEKRERELDKWRRFRIQAVLHLNTNRGEKDPAIMPEEFMLLPGDPPPVLPEVMTEDEFDRIAAAY